MQAYGDDELGRAARRIFDEGRPNPIDWQVRTALGTFATDDRATWRMESGAWTAGFRVRLERLLAGGSSCVQLIAQTADAEEAQDWLNLLPNIEGVVAKRADGRYEPGQRRWIKVKHQRTADCVVIGVAGDQSHPWLVASLGNRSHGFGNNMNVLHGHIGIQPRSRAVKLFKTTIGALAVAAVLAIPATTTMAAPVETDGWQFKDNTIYTDIQNHVGQYDAQITHNGWAVSGNKHDTPGTSGDQTTYPGSRADSVHWAQSLNN